MSGIRGADIFMKIAAATSVILDYAYFERAELFIEFRFHSNCIQEVNNLLIDGIKSNDGFRVVKLANSRNIKDRMAEFNRLAPVSALRYSLPVPEDSPIGKYMSKYFPDSIGELQVYSATEEGTKVLIYTSMSPDQEGLKVISADSKIYQLSINPKVLVEGQNMQSMARIPRLASFLTQEGGDLVYTTFVPAAEGDEFLSILSSLLTETFGSKPSVQYYSMLDDVAWDWI